MTILQCAPTWIAVEDFNPEELGQLSSFDTRMRPQVMASDKQRCTKLAAITVSPGDHSSPLVQPSMQDLDHQGSTKRCPRSEEGGLSSV
jgi:hypothetical protein